MKTFINDPDNVVGKEITKVSFLPTGYMVMHFGDEVLVLRGDEVFEEISWVSTPKALPIFDLRDAGIISEEEFNELRVKEEEARTNRDRMEFKRLRKKFA